MVVIACRDTIAIELQPSDAAPQPDPLIIPFAWQPEGRRKGVAHEPSTKPRLDHETGQTLLIAIAKARSWMAGLINGTVSSTDAIAAREQMGKRNVRQLLPLACLSPQVIQAIVDGQAPADFTIRSLTAALSHQWIAQHQRFLIV